MENLICYDPLLFKLPKGTVEKNKKVKFSLKCEDADVKRVLFFVKADNEQNYTMVEMTKKSGKFECEFLFKNAGHFWYHFKVIKENQTLFVSKTYDNFSVVSESKGDDFFQLVTKEKYNINGSMQGGIIYQIFVDRFARVGNSTTRNPLVLRDDWGGKIKKNTTNPIKINEEVFGGNFKGIISKLDYLEDLGVTTIYLSPICEAHSNHKYDTADYMKIDPMYGTEEDFCELIQKAKQKGIGIVLDGVYNHTGSDSIYFNKNGRYAEKGAYQGTDSKYYEWYEFENYPNKYASWWGIETLPSIKDNSESFQNFIAGKNGVLEKYLKTGIKGVRLDVVDEIVDDFVTKISNKVKEFGNDKVIMGEVWEDASTKIAYSKRRTYFSNNELNSIMNYPIKETIIQFVKTGDSSNLVSTIRMLQNNYPEAVQHNLMNFLTTHDTSRVFSELKNACEGDEQKTKQLLKIATALLFTMTGVPSIFYGDEYGMQNNDESSRGCFDWENYKNDIFEWYKKLTTIRKHKVFESGDLNILYSQNGKFVFERISNSERIIVVANVSNEPLNINFHGKFVSCLTQKTLKETTISNFDVEIIKEIK